MSATGRGTERRELDLYETPPWCVDRLLDVLDLPPGPWLEPAFGGGEIVAAVDAWRSRHGQPAVDWTTVDIRAEPEPDVVADFTWWGCPELDAVRPASGRWAVTITNPPYYAAWEYAKAARRCSETVALLLRLNWLEGRKRQPAISTPPPGWLRCNTPDVYVLPDRPSFDGDGTDATAYAWMVWSPSAVGRLRILGSTPQHERRAAAIARRRLELVEATQDGEFLPAPGRPWVCCGGRHEEG